MASRKAEVIFVGDADSLVAAALKSKAAIKSLQDQANQKSGLDKLPQLGGNISAGITAAVPAVFALTGALGGLAASATAAAGGAGAVAVGGLGALVAGFGSVALVVKPAVTNFQNVSKALDAYNLVLANHSTTAKQAEAAQAKLNATVTQNGGASVLTAAKAWDSLGESFQKLTKPAQATMFKTLNDGLATMKTLLPTVAGIANTSMKALSDALTRPMSLFTGSEFKGILTSLGNTFAKAIGPGLNAAALSFLAFSRIAQAAGPYVVQLAKAIEDLAIKFAQATADPQKLSTIIGNLVANAQSWGALISAVGKLIFDVFKQGVDSGKGMVDSLTKIVDKWDAWAKSAKGAKDITDFFKQSGQFTKELFSALGPVVSAFSTLSVGALPVYVKLMSNLKGVMGPLTYAFVAYKVALVAAGVATGAYTAVSKASTAIMWLFNDACLGTRLGLLALAIQEKATAVATAALDIVMDANPIVLLATAIAALVAGLVYLVTQTNVVSDVWKALKTAFQAVFSWVGGAATQAFGIVKTAAADGLLGPIALVIARWNQIPGIFSAVWGDITKAIDASAGAILSAAESVVMAPINWIKGLFNTLFDVGKYIIQGLIGGIESMAKTVLNAAKDVVTAPINLAKSILGIGSPSKVFNEIGVNIGEGLVNGIRSMQSTVNSAMSSIADGLVKGILSSKEMIADGLNQSLLYPVDAAIAALQLKATTLQATWAKIDSATQRQGLVEAVSNATDGSTGTGSINTSSSSTLSGVPAGVTKMLQFALASVGGPYSKAQHGAAFNELPAAIKKFGTDCSGFISALLKAGGTGITSAQTTQGLPTNAGLSKGAGKYVTVFDRSTGATSDEHTLIEIMGKFFESGGNSKFNPSGGISQLSSAQAAGELAGGGFQSYHPTNLNSAISGSTSNLVASVSGAMKGGKLSANQMRGLLYAAGFRGKDLDTAVAIGFAESGGDPNAINKNTDGSTDRGFEQINSVHGSLSTTNPSQNAAAAFKIYKSAGGKFTDWTTFNSGAYKQFLGNTGSGRGSSTAVPSAIANALTASGGGGSTGNVASAIQALQQFDTQAKRAQRLATITLKIQNLTQLKNFQDAISGLRTQLQGLAQQAAQAWNAIQTGNINAAHDAAIAAINSGTDATTLASMQAQDTVSANAATLAGLQTTLTTAQTLAANSGGQAHLDALQQVQDAQAALDAFARQQTEDQLQANVDAATKAADDSQTTALAGLTQQTTDYQNNLNAQFQILTDQLNQRKISYATWAKDVNAILATYGLSVSTDPSTEGAVTAGPGPAAPAGSGPAPVVGTNPPTISIAGKAIAGHPTWGGHRASGGPVVPGYVYRVGEHGPEDVAFGRPGMVMTAAQTKRASGGGNVHIHGNLVVNSHRAAKSMADRLAFRAALGTA